MNCNLVLPCEQSHFVNTQVYYLYNKAHKRCVKVTVKMFVCIIFTALLLVFVCAFVG